MSKVFLKYAFIVEPNTTFQSITDFESMLANFLGEHGFKGEYIESAPGQEAMRIMEITQVSSLDFSPPQEAPVQEPPKSPKAYAKEVVKAYAKPKRSTR